MVTDTNSKIKARYPVTNTEYDLTLPEKPEFEFMGNTESGFGYRHLVYPKPGQETYVSRSEKDNRAFNNRDWGRKNLDENRPTALWKRYKDKKEVQALLESSKLTNATEEQKELANDLIAEAIEKNMVMPLARTLLLMTEYKQAIDPKKVNEK